MSKRKKIVWASCITCLLLIVSTTLFLFYLHQKNTSPIPEAIQKKYNHPLYYPKELPTGWEIDPASYQVNNDVFLYVVKHKTNNAMNISISIQPQPKAFNFDKFYKEILTKSTQFTTNLGQANIGDGDNGFKVGSLTTGDTWILASSSSSKTTTNDIRFILSNLEGS